MKGKKVPPTKKLTKNKVMRWGGDKLFGIPLKPAIFVLTFACIGLATLILTKAQGYETGSNSTQITLTNDYRAERGLSRLKPSGCLTDIANRWALHMAVVEKEKGIPIHHTSGKVGSTVVHSGDPGPAYYLGQECTSGGAWSLYAENVGVTGSDSVSLFKAFVASTSHRENIVRPQLDLIGVGSYRTFSGRLYMAVLFADCNGCTGAWTASPETKPKPTNPYPCSTYPTLAPGSTNTSCIKHLQWLLNYIAGQNVAENGVYGSSTVNAVKNIENFFRISPADGIADKKVWDILRYIYGTR